MREFGEFGLMRWLGSAFVMGALFLDAEEKGLRQLRILPVGDAPPFRQEIRDGVRHELEAAKGSEPPYLIEVLAKAKVEEGEDSKEGRKLQEISLRLNQVTEPLKLPAAASTVALLDRAVPWHRLEVPEGENAMAIFWRDPVEGDWDKARSLILSDGASFGDGSVRFVNVCPAVVALMVGEERLMLKPGEWKSLNLGGVEGVKFQLAYDDAKRGWRPFYSTTLTQGKGQRSTYVAYRADGVKPRQPVKVAWHRENTVPLAHPVERGAEKPR